MCRLPLAVCRPPHYTSRVPAPSFCESHRCDSSWFLIFLRRSQFLQKLLQSFFFKVPGLVSEVFARTGLRIGISNFLLMPILLPSRSTESRSGVRCGLETAAETAVVIDGEGTDQVDRSWSAESDTKTFSYVHRGFTTVALTECYLHTCQGGRYRR